MEKLIYAIWKPEGDTADSFRDQILAELGPQVSELEQVHGVRLAVADSAVEAAANKRMESHPPVPDGILSLWVDAAEAAPAWQGLLDSGTLRWSAYHVVEAEPLRADLAHPSGLGERVYGMCQVVFLSGPTSLPRDEWLSIWKNSHTQLAIDTQSTFGYRQNLVVRTFSENATPCDAIVEEHFPPEAMASDHAFYASGGDEILLQKNMTAMMESVARFIDFEHIDVIPMSEYVIKQLGA